MAKQPENTRGTRAFDKEAGDRLRSYRNHANMSQQQLGDKLGVTFQQIQKYERGSNRLSFGRAVHVSKLFEVDLREFAGMNGAKLEHAIEAVDFKLAVEFSALDPAMKPEALSLLKFLNKHAKTNSKRARK